MNDLNLMTAGLTPNHDREPFTVPALPQGRPAQSLLGLEHALAEALATLRSIVSHPYAADAEYASWLPDPVAIEYASWAAHLPIADR